MAYNIGINNLNLNTQQITLLHEARRHIIEKDIKNINVILDMIV